MTGALTQTIAFHRDPLGFLGRERDAHGDVFEVRLLTARPLAIVANPELAESLLDADPERAGAGVARRRLLPFASPRSAFGGDGEAHRAARQRIAPAFAAEAMAAHREKMAAIAARRAEGWPRDRPFRLLERMRDIADEIFVRLVLGVADRDRAGRLVAAIRRTVRTPGNPPVSLPGPGNGLLGAVGERIFERRWAPLGRELSLALEARREEAPGEDVLGLMVGDGRLSTEEAVDQLTSLLMAAQEPPAIALTWLLDRLAREPEHAERFRAEPGGDRADAIVRETLRLNPPAGGVLRRLREPLRGGGRELPAGMTVLVPIALLHRDPRTYERPERFRPERWTGQRPPALFMPFGGGARRCVGEPLARAELESVVPAVLDRVRLRPLRPERERMVGRATVLVPRRSMLVTAEQPSARVRPADP